ARRSVVRCVPGTQWITDQRKEPLTLALSCDQLCPITWDIYTDHQGTDGHCPGDQCSPISATCHCPSVQINATYQCPSELPFSATYQYQSVPPMSAANQCQSAPPISSHQCRLSVPVSAAYQCCLSV
ncbi:unnamed protein product, partial [Staurois parvus]